MRGHLGLVGQSELSPDGHGAGLTGMVLDALRYDGHSDHPSEVAGMLHALMSTKARVLDVGCGTGSVTIIANRGKNNTVVAIEPDTERAAVARARGLDVHECFIDEQFIMQNGQFDVVMSSDVLEHLASPAEYLSLLKKAVKPGGTLLLSVPNVAHWSVRLNLLFGRFDYEPVGIMDSTHLRWFTARSLRALLSQCGIHQIEMHQTAGIDLPVYRRGPIRRIPKRVQAPAVRLLAKAFPNVFGVQHVVRARIGEAASASA